MIPFLVLLGVVLGCACGMRIDYFPGHGEVVIFVGLLVSAGVYSGHHAEGSSVQAGYQNGGERST
jgi:hypothetical protein